MRVLRIVVCSLFLNGCAANATPSPSLERDTYIVPLAANDTDRICVETWELPRCRYVSVGDLRSYVRSLKAEP